MIVIYKSNYYSYIVPNQTLLAYLLAIACKEVHHILRKFHELQ